MLKPLCITPCRHVGTCASSTDVLYFGQVQVNEDTTIDDWR